MLDSLDMKLIKLLSRNARQSSEVLAEQLEVSSATVRRRLRRLFKSDALRVIGVVDPSKFGFPLQAIIGLDVGHKNIESALEFLTDWPEVKWASITAGRFDILFIAMFTSTENLSDFFSKQLSKLDYIKDSETFIVLDIAKVKYVWL